MESNIKCLIVDDEPLAIDVIRNYLKRLDNVTYISCQDTGDAFDLLIRQKFDLLFLDIEMPCCSGLDLLERITDLPAVIVTTAYNKYAVKCFDFEIVDYLTKPISFPRFLKAWERAMKINNPHDKSPLLHIGSGIDPVIRISDKLKNKLESISLLPEIEFKFFVSQIEVKSLAPGDLLVSERDFCNDIYFVEEGLLRTYLTLNRKQVNTEFSFEGNFVSAFSGFILRKSAGVDIEALEQSTVLVINRMLLERLCKMNAQWLIVSKFIFEHELLKKNDRVSSFLRLKAKQRYLNFFDEFPKVEQRVPLRHIASYLGIEPETLSRIRSGKFND